MPGHRILILGLIVLGFSISFVPAPPAQAQEAETVATSTEAEAEGEHAKAEPRKSYFWWFIESSGFIGLGLLILSIYFIQLVIRLFLEMKPDVVAPPTLVAEAENLVQQRDFKGAYNLLRADDSFFGRVTATGIEELSNGLPDAREAMERVGEAETVDMEKQISMLAVLGTLGPMIGLLGTLKGMIASFSVIALSDVQLKASEVAGGISEALLLTFEGVALSVPAIYFFAVFRNRVSSLSVVTMLQADHFLRNFAQSMKAKPATGTGTPPGGAAARTPTRV